MAKLTDDQKEAFIRDGFIILPGFVPTELVDAAESRIDTAYENGRYNKSIKKLLGRDQPTPNFYQSVKQSQEIMDLMYKAGLFEIAEDLVGEGHAVIRHDFAQIAWTSPCQHFIDEGMDIHEPQPKFRWHIDAGKGKYAAQGTDFSFLMGVALSEGQEVDENRGQFTVWPGSHHHTHPALADAFKNNPEGNDVVKIFMRSKKPKCGEPQRALLRRGDAMIVHQRLAHAPGVNLWDKPRKNVYFRVIHSLIDDILPQQMSSPTPWVGFSGLKDFLPDGATEYEIAEE